MQERINDNNFYFFQQKKIHHHYEHLSLLKFKDDYEIKHCDYSLSLLKDHHEINLNYPIHYINNHKAKNVIVVLTEMVEDTLGDVNGALRLILLLKKEYPQFKFQWIIRKDKTVTLPQSITSSIEDIVVIENWTCLNGTFLNPILFSEQSKINKACIVLIYPALIAFNAAGEALLKMMMPMHSRILSITEYDQMGLELFDHLGDAVKKSRLSIGFARHALGIYLEEFPCLSIEKILQQLDDPEFQSFINLEKNTFYHENHLFFQAYFNKNVNHAKNKVTPFHFCLIIAAYTRRVHAHQKHLDMLVSLTEVDLEQFEIRKLFKQNINTIKIQIGETCHVYQNPNPTQDGRFLNISNRFIKHQFLLTLQLAFRSAIAANLTPFIGCTGDQSLSEVLSLTDARGVGAIPFYQVMPWKVELANSLKTMISEHANEKLVLRWYFMIMLLLKPEIKMERSSNSFFLAYLEITKNENKSFINMMVDFLSDPSLICQMHQFNAILQKKNLYRVLPEKIAGVIRECHPHFKVEATNAVSQATQLRM